MRKSTKRVLVGVMMTMLLAGSIQTTANAATVGQVKSVKTKTSYKYYKGVKRTRPLK